jgi:hypothetical protein
MKNWLRDWQPWRKEDDLVLDDEAFEQLFEQQQQAGAEAEAVGGGTVNKLRNKDSGGCSQFPPPSQQFDL